MQKQIRTKMNITGEVDPGPVSNKWYNTWAECKGIQTQVSATDGTFSLPNVPIDSWGENILTVVATDVSGNSSTQQRRVIKQVTDASETFKYDGNGNLTNWVCGTTNWIYQWDWADRLTKATSNGVVVLENWYDVWGRRTTKAERNSTCMYLWAGWGTIAVCQTNGNLMESYSRSIGLSSTYDLGTLVSITSQFGSYYTHNNNRGDVNLIRSGAATVGELEYDTFGAIKRLTGLNMSRFKFSSKEFDASIQMFCFGSRYYAPRWQRWLSRERNGEIRGLNLYRFVHNDPICAVDGNGDDDWGGFPWEGGIENGCTNTLDVVDDDNKRCAKVPPGKKSKKGCDYDFVKLPDGTWWKIGPGELDIGKDGKPCRGQIRHRKATEGEAKACEEALKDATRKSKQN